MRTPPPIAALAATVAIAAAHGAPLRSIHEPQEQRPPVFRSSVQVVEVDIIVRDSQGRFVHDLTADDLEIYEEGRRHGIDIFYLVSRDAPLDPARNIPQVIETRQAERVFVLIFDQGHLTTESVHRLKRAAETFLRTEFGPGDVGGIFHGGAMANGRLTSSRVELLGALKQVQPSQDSRASRMLVFREFPRINGEYEATRIEGGDARTLANLAQQNCQDDPVQCRMEGGLEMVEAQLDRKARQYVDEARAATSRVLRTLSVVAAGVGRVPGRKTVVLMTEGFFSEEARPVLQQIAAQAARSGVTVYALDGKGTRSVAGRDLPDAATTGAPVRTSFDTAADGPQILAATTGGFVIRGTNDLLHGLTRIAEDTSTYYVAGYTPALQKLDGSMRNIEVKSKRQGLQVRARKAYLATPLPQVR